jgi:hypothetical protein
MRTLSKTMAAIEAAGTIQIRHEPPRNINNAGKTIACIRTNAAAA